MAGASEDFQPVRDDTHSDESNDDCLQLQDTSDVAKSHPGAASSISAGSVGTHSECLKTFTNLSLEKDTPQKLKDEKLTVDDISPIGVVQHEGKHVTLGNSRLRVLKEFGRSTPVNIVEHSSEEFIRKLSRRQDDSARIRIATNKKNQVRQIPERFLNEDSYYEAFKWPLLEDTRAQLQGSLEDAKGDSRDNGMKEDAKGDSRDNGMKEDAKGDSRDNGMNVQSQGRPAKFYAVARGRRPGIYYSWVECAEQVTGYSGCCFKSFVRQRDAEDFLARRDGYL